MANECNDGVTELDPVQGLFDYISDIKPYHTKIIEVLIEYVYEEAVDVTILEETDWVIDIVRPAVPVIDSTSSPIDVGGICAAGSPSILPFGGPGQWPIVSPNSGGHNITYPFGFNVGLRSFTIPGNRAGEIIPGTTIQLTSSVEDYSNMFDIVGFVNVGSPTTPYTRAFVVSDPLVGSPPSQQFALQHSPGDIIETLGTAADDGRPFTITSITPGGSPAETVVEVEQVILTPEFSVTVGSPATGGSPLITTPIPPTGQLGLVRTPGNNTGTFTVDDVQFSGGTIDQWPGFPGLTPPDYLVGDDPHTIITVVEPINNPTEAFTGSPVVGSPLLLPTFQAYIATLRLGNVAIEKVLSYSNVIPHEVLPDGQYNNPDEGVSRRDVVGVTPSMPGSPLNTGSIVVSGNWEVSNIFPGDTVRIIQSTNNNGTFTIRSISYDEVADETTVGLVDAVLTPSSPVDGIAEINIPSNVFVVDGNSTSRFVQGYRFAVTGGTFSGEYTTLTSGFVNGKTRIRPVQEIIDSPIKYQITDTTTGFHVYGDLSSVFSGSPQPGDVFNVVGTESNDGSYTVDSVIYPAGSPETNFTIIVPVESIIPDEDGGQIYFSQLGVIRETAVGFGETADICEDVPEEVLRVTATEFLETVAFKWGNPYEITIIGMNVGGSPPLGSPSANTIFVAGDITNILNNGDEAIIVDSSNNDGDYEIVSFRYNATLGRTEIVLTGPLSQPGGSPPVFGTLQLEDIDIVPWFQYLLKEANYLTDELIIHGNAIKDIQIGQQFRVYGNTNAGLHKAETSPVYDPATNTTTVKVVSAGGSPPPTGSNNIEPVVKAIVGVVDTNILRVQGNIVRLTGGDPFEISGSTLNDGSYVVQGVEHVGNDTLITLGGSPALNPVSIGGSVLYNDRGGWVESFRDQGIHIVLTDLVGMSVVENVEGAVLQTGGPIIGAWDYPYWDVGSFDESLGTVIHLYGNSP